jgi:hypothetical protein
VAGRHALAWPAMRSPSAATVLSALLLPTLATAQLPCYEPALGVNLQLGDDQVSTNRPLGFSFPLPGGGTTTIVSV